MEFPRKTGRFGQDAHDFQPTLRPTSALDRKTLNDAFFIPGHELLSQSAVYGTGAPTGRPGARAMPADVSFQDVGTRRVSIEAGSSSSRLPLGIGLAVAASASVGLWFAVAAGIRALFF